MRGKPPKRLPSPADFALAQHLKTPHTGTQRTAQPGHPRRQGWSLFFPWCLPFSKPHANGLTGPPPVCSHPPGWDRSRPAAPEPKALPATGPHTTGIENAQTMGALVSTWLSAHRRSRCLCPELVVNHGLLTRPRLIFTSESMVPPGCCAGPLPRWKGAQPTAQLRWPRHWMCWGL